MYFDQSGLAMVGSAEDEDIPGLESEYIQTQCVLADGGDRFGVCALAFDQSEELIWMGNEGGHVTSYYMGQMQKYTSFQVHASQEIRQIDTFNEGILCLTAGALRCQIRRGIPVFTHVSQNMKEMQCMLQLSPTRLLIAGHSNIMVDFNMTVCKETKMIDVGNAGCVMLRNHNRYVCAGNPMGQIDLRDPNTLNIENTLKTHSGSLSDFDVQGNLLVTCGFTNRQGNLNVDRFLMVYDLRMTRRAITPIQTVVDPLYLRFMPSVSSRLTVVSALGQIQLVDTVALSEQRISLVNVDNPGAMCLAFDIPSTSQALGLGFNNGSIHLLSSAATLNSSTGAGEPVFNSYSRMTEHADTPHTASGMPIPQPNTPGPASFAIDDYSTPLSAVPMPVLGDGAPLLSDWPDYLMEVSYRPTPPIDPEILRTMKMQGPIGYAPNPKQTRRNQVSYNLTASSNSHHVSHHLTPTSSHSHHSSPAHHRSPHTPNPHHPNQHNGRGAASTPDGGNDPHSVTGGVNGNAGGAGLNSSGFVAIPKRYRKIDVKFNKMGTAEEFMFDQYNRTGLAGLEAVLPNAYCNAMIQVLYYTEPLRATLMSHLCVKEFCLSCELGFLFHMLFTTTPGTPCQPGNFLRAFRTVPEASALGLILSDLHPDAKQKIDLGALIQSWNRFMLHQMHVEVLETRRKLAESRATSATASAAAAAALLAASNAKKAAPFVYKDSDFPSILGVPNSGVVNVERKKSNPNAPNVEELTQDLQQDKLTPSDQNLAPPPDSAAPNDSDELVESTEISRLFGTKQLHSNTCLKCHNQSRKTSILLACNLVYPTGEPQREEWSFCEILKRSLTPKQTTPAWCEPCAKFQPTLQLRSLQSLPKLLAINTGLHNPQHKLFWQSQMDKIVAKATDLNAQRSSTPTTNSSATTPAQTQNPATAINTSTKPCRYGDQCTRPGCRFRHLFDTQANAAALNNPYCSNNWLPHKIKMIMEPDSKDSNVNTLKIIKVGENSDEIEEKSDDEDNIYHLTAVVCYVHEQNERKNLVALLKIAPGYLTNNEASPQSGQTNKDRWYLFNDFSISPVPAQEATWFSLDWKTPCVLYYTTSEVINSKTDVSGSITKEVFSQDNCIARSTSPGTPTITTFTPLAEDEFPKPTELVAMDAEFVTLNQEESELRSDGKMSTVKPSQMSVARVTCIRGQGLMEGTPFIDDYISTQEQVVDYLTKFSGIKPGDLDANFSSKHLTTLKSTYVKLRFLVDSGVIFVGHGLKNDFRVINLVVPPEQVVDTVLLFHLPHHRMVSLRFLAWHFLGMKIQSETHDSTEDARAALQLYRQYKELERECKVGDALSELYETGKVLQWKVPED